MQYVLVTGSNGMLGSNLVKKLVEFGYNVVGVSLEKEPIFYHKRYIYKSLDLKKCLDVEALFNEYKFKHIIHLAAIAHTYKGMDDSWSQYYRVNTMCSKTLFQCANENSIPVFFASTVDVYGIVGGEGSEELEPHPISPYAKSKWLAEKALLNICKNNAYMIARFAPIYSEDNKKDIHKRYFIRYPSICYKIGRGAEFEFLSVDKAVDVIVKWLSLSAEIRGVYNVRDEKRVHTDELIANERVLGNVKLVVYIPQWLVSCLKIGINHILRKKELLRFKAYKVLSPLKTNNQKMIDFMLM